MNATISLNSVTLADVPVNGLGHVAVSGGRKPIAHQRARFTVDADQRCCTAGLIEQVPDLAKIADALLAQQRRSEEHTSELQSRRDLVCRLLLEKKKNEIRRTLTSDKTPRQCQRT